MNGEAGPLKADLSTFNIEILQISKRIAPKSGLRWPAPHSPPDSPARPPKSLISFGLAAGGAPTPARANRGKSSLLSLLGPRPGTRPLLPRSALLPGWLPPGARLYRTPIPPLTAISQAGALSYSLPPCLTGASMSQRRARLILHRSSGKKWMLLGKGGGPREETISLTKLSSSGFEEKSGFSARTCKKQGKSA